MALALGVVVAGSASAMTCSTEGPRTQDEENLRGERRAAACAAPYEALQAAIGGTIGYDAVGRDVIVSFSDRFSAYDDGCIGRLEELRCPTVSFLDRVLAVVFEQGDASAEIICTASRVAPDLVLTAQHCLWVGNTSVRKDLSKLRLALAGEPGRRFDVIEEHPATQRSERDFNDYSDVALLRVDFSEGPAFEGVVIGAAPATDQRIIAPGVFVPALVLAGMATTTDDPALWREAIRVDDSHQCARFAKGLNGRTIHAPSSIQARYCILTRCQTFSGMSGAPVVSFEPDRGFVVSGVYLRHAYAAGGTGAACGSIPGHNLAIALQAGVMHAIMEASR